MCVPRIQCTRTVEVGKCETLTAASPVFLGVTKSQESGSLLDFISIIMLDREEIIIPDV